MSRDWDNTYREKGVVQREVLATVVESVEHLKAHGCRSVLDLCCGTGRHTVYLAGHGFHVHAVDVSSHAVEITSKRVADERHRNVSVAVGDARSIPLASASVDAVVCTWSLGHGYRADLVATVAEAARVLRPGGLFLADVPSKADPRFGKGVLVAPSTYLHPELDHADVPHHYLDAHEVYEVISGHCTVLECRQQSYDDPKGRGAIISHWVRARRRRPTPAAGPLSDAKPEPSLGPV
jgi:SAM-dependent methyltransferase